MHERGRGRPTLTILRAPGPLSLSSSRQGEGKASAKAYGSATHFKAGASQGTTRTFVGLYNFELAHQGYTVRGWFGVGLSVCLSLRVWGFCLGLVFGSILSGCDLCSPLSSIPT